MGAGDVRQGPHSAARVWRTSSRTCRATIISPPAEATSRPASVPLLDPDDAGGGIAEGAAPGHRVVEGKPFGPPRTLPAGAAGKVAHARNARKSIVKTNGHDFIILLSPQSGKAIPVYECRALGSRDQLALSIRHVARKPEQDGANIAPRQSLSEPRAPDAEHYHRRAGLALCSDATGILAS